MKHENIKQNINFLEYPLWFQDEIAATRAKQGMTWSDREGYIYKAGYKTPAKIDAIFLLYLLMQSQKNGCSQKLTLTRYQVLNNCGLVICAKSYDRLEDSLERWKMVGIKFSGTFYDGKSYQTMNFGIIDSWEIDKVTKKMHIWFSPKFLTMMLGKGFFKYINFTEFKQLHSPLATRLYEILCKSFHGRDVWEINAIKLANKIPMKERYPAHIVPKIKSALNRINRISETKFVLETRRVERGNTVFCFKKEAVSRVSSAKKESTKQSFLLPGKPEIRRLVELLPLVRRSQKTILEHVVAFYEMCGADYVARNIRYTNKNATNNYRPYLIKALQNDYGLAMYEDEEAERQAAAEKARKAQELAEREAVERKRQKEQEERKKLVQAYIENLSEEARLDLQLDAISSMSDDIKQIVLKKGAGWKVLLKLAMEKVALQMLAESEDEKAVGSDLEMEEEC